MNPATGRFLTEDTHWNPQNMIYGDNPVKWNEREPDERDPLGLNTYTLVPDITAIRQNANLYAYCMNNPILYRDSNGNFAFVVAGVVITGKAIAAFSGAVAAAAGASAALQDPRVQRGLIDAGNALQDGAQAIREGAEQLYNNAKDVIIGSEKATEAPAYPGNDPTKSPGKDWEWKGKGEVGSRDGNWYNPKTGETLHPDLDHPAPIPPHWDYKDPDGNWYRKYPDGKLEPKKK